MLHGHRGCGSTNYVEIPHGFMALHVKTDQPENPENTRGKRSNGNKKGRSRKTGLLMTVELGRMQKMTENYWDH
jgi:hypothetical protein